jgi:hypothetical protein
MHISFTLDWWLVLPLLLTITLVVGGLWVDGLPVLDLDATIIALIVCAVCWAAILYGRYERWLIFPIYCTVCLVVITYRERKDLKREGLKSVAAVLIISWALVLYGRLTA